MDTATLDANTITLMATIAGSWLTLVGVIIFQTSRLDTKFDALGGDVAGARERLARMEGHLMCRRVRGHLDESHVDTETLCVYGGDAPSGAATG